MHKFYILRSSKDPDNFIFGIYNQQGDKFTGWAIIYIDAVSDLFGNEIAIMLKQMPFDIPKAFYMTLEKFIGAGQEWE